MTSKIVFCLPLTLLLLTVAEAQQPTKVPRIGFLGGVFPFHSNSPPRGIPPGIARAWLCGGKKHRH